MGQRLTHHHHEDNEGQQQQHDQRRRFRLRRSRKYRNNKYKDNNMTASTISYGSSHDLSSSRSNSSSSVTHVGCIPRSGSSSGYNNHEHDIEVAISDNYYNQDPDNKRILMDEHIEMIRSLPDRAEIIESLESYSFP